jgi:hypothetical protein
MQINCVRLTYGHRDKHEQYSGSVQKNVKRALEVPAKIVDSAVLRHEENQEHPDLEDANRLSLSEPVNQPSLRGSVNGITGSNPGHPFLQPFSTSPGLTEQSGIQSESNKPNWYKIHKIISAMTMRPGRVYKPVHYFISFRNSTLWLYAALL